MKHLSFGRERKLTESGAFKRAFATRPVHVSAHFSFYAVPNSSAGARLGLAISKRACAQAVWRNRLKRVAREAFRVNQHVLKGLDIVVATRRKCPLAASEELRLAFSMFSSKSARCAQSSNSCCAPTATP